MSIFSKLSKVDQKFSWSFLGFIIGIIGIGFAIYTIFFFEKVPVIKYEVISNTNVLDVKENVSRLDILFDSVSVKKTGQNLRVITLKISNEGNENLNADYFDKKYPLGFQIEGARIVQKPELLEFSNDYIKETIELNDTLDNKILFSNIIIDQGEYFIVKTLTLSDAKVVPTIKPLGYISGSGAPRLVIINEENETTPKSFFTKLFYGNLGYHIARFFLYLIIIGISIFLIAFPISQIQEKKQEKNKKKHVRKFKQNTKIDKEKLSEIVFDFYLEDGESSLFRIKKILSMPDKLKGYKNYLELREEYERFEYSGFRHRLEEQREMIIYDSRQNLDEDSHRIHRISLFDQLVEKGIISFNESEVL
ncbi:MAG: hypothetical protein IH596_04305, partial [Bacteroidales bacterium]|nr:hypothetical protein [Bacteroidales bacterium]